MSNSNENCSSLSIRATFVVWVFSGLVMLLQIASNQGSGKDSKLRFLEKDADEDDRIVTDDYDNEMETFEWYQLERWVEPTSLTYDIIEGFLYAADAFFVAWICWGCGVHCGIFPDTRLDRRRKERRHKDGRGVFAPLRTSEDPENSDDDDDASRDSMEYGDSHQDADFGEVDLLDETEKLNKAAQRFFGKAEKKKKQKKPKQADRGPAEEELLLDLEMTENIEQPGSKPADLVFL